MVILDVLFIALVFFSVLKAGNIYQYYKDGNGDMKLFATNFANIFQLEIEDFGCPNKYIPLSPGCPAPLHQRRWEWNLPTFQTPIMCLNQDCSGLTGEMFAEIYYPLINSSLLAALVANILIFSLISLIRRPENLAQNQASTKETKFWFAAHFIFFGGLLYGFYHK